MGTRLKSDRAYCYRHIFLTELTIKLKEKTYIYVSFCYSCAQTILVVPWKIYWFRRSGLVWYYDVSKWRKGYATTNAIGKSFSFPYWTAFHFERHKLLHLELLSHRPQSCNSKHVETLRNTTLHLIINVWAHCH